MMAASVISVVVLTSNLVAGESELALTNKAKAVAVLNSIETGDQVAVGYINPENYTQHNLGVADGLAGFGEVLKALPEGSAKVSVKRAFEDGPFVFTHTEYNFFGPKIGFDIFRFEEGRIVEHWDNLQETATQTVSGRSQTDGPTEIQDLDKTANHKKLVTGFAKDVLLGENPDKITNYISTEKYHQHNPHVADGLDGLGEALQKLAEAGTPMVYSKNHALFGEGNFILSVSEGKFLGNPVAFYDLFRVEAGKIVEHWDTIEEIPAKADWKNQNGKFGFPG